MVFMVLTALFISLFTQPPQQSDTSIVEGFVRTAGTSLPIPGAEVNVFEASSNGRIQTITDADGHFRLAVQPGQYRVIATKQGFSSPAFRPIEPAPASIVTAFAGQRASMDFQLVPEGTVTGRVFDPEGRPMEGISVTLSRLGWTGTGQRKWFHVARRFCRTDGSRGEWPRRTHYRRRAFAAK